MRAEQIHQNVFSDRAFQLWEEADRLALLFREVKEAEEEPAGGIQNYIVYIVGFRKR